MLSNGNRVLVVDDEADIRDGVKRWLHAAGYTTQTACNGEEGVAMACSDSPQAILLDVRMPKKNGLEVLADLRADLKTSRIPVVMLSASLRDEQLALDAGAKYFIHKPYSGKNLVAAITAAINEQAAH